MAKKDSLFRNCTQQERQVVPARDCDAVDGSSKPAMPLKGAGPFWIPCHHIMPCNNAQFCFLLPFEFVFLCGLLKKMDANLILVNFLKQ